RASTAFLLMPASASARKAASAMFSRALRPGRSPKAVRPTPTAATAARRLSPFHLLATPSATLSATLASLRRSEQNHLDAVDLADEGAHAHADPYRLGRNVHHPGHEPRAFGKVDQGDVVVALGRTARHGAAVDAALPARLHPFQSRRAAVGAGETRIKHVLPAGAAMLNAKFAGCEKFRVGEVRSRVGESVEI